MPRCCLCSSPEMLMGGLGARPGQPPRLGEPPPTTPLGSWGARLWAGLLLGILVGKSTRSPRCQMTS